MFLLTYRPPLWSNGPAFNSAQRIPSSCTRSCPPRSLAIFSWPTLPLLLFPCTFIFNTFFVVPSFLPKCVVLRSHFVLRIIINKHAPRFWHSNHIALAWKSSVFDVGTCFLITITYSGSVRLWMLVPKKCPLKLLNLFDWHLEILTDKSAQVVCEERTKNIMCSVVIQFVMYTYLLPVSRNRQGCRRTTVDIGDNLLPYLTVLGCC